MSNNDKRILFPGRGQAESINVGYGNFVVASRIVAILESGSLPVRRLREKASEMNLLLDATSGRKMRSLIIIDSNHVVLSALMPQTLQERLRGGTRDWINPAEIELSEGEFVS